MKTPRINDFDPNAKEPTLNSPLENMPSIQKPEINANLPENMNSGNHENLKTGIHENMISSKPEIMKPGIQENLKTGIHEKPKNLQTNFVKSVKYSTQLAPKLKKDVQVYALQQDMKDYEVVELAIEECLKNHQ